MHPLKMPQRVVFDSKQTNPPSNGQTLQYRIVSHVSTFHSLFKDVKNMVAKFRGVIPTIGCLVAIVLDSRYARLDQLVVVWWRMETKCVSIVGIHRSGVGNTIVVFTTYKLDNEQSDTPRRNHFFRLMLLNTRVHSYGCKGRTTNSGKI